MKTSLNHAAQAPEPADDSALNCSFLPANIPPARPPLSREPTCCVLKSQQEFSESVGLLESEYLRVQHIDRSMTPEHPLEFHPSSVTLAIKSPQDALIMRATMVLTGKTEWSPDLPCMVQPQFADIVRKTPGLKAEVTRLASSHTEGTLKNTARLMNEMALMSLSLNVDRLFLVCHPKHASFYVGCFEADEKATVAEYAGIKDKPGTLLEITIADFYHFTRWAPPVIMNQVAGPIHMEKLRVLSEYDQRIQAQRIR